MGFAALGVVLILVLVVAYRRTVRDHFEAWCFQLGRKTETIDPPPPGRTATISSPLTMRERADAYRQDPGVRVLTGREMRIAAHELRSPVIFDPADVPPFLTDPQMPRTVCNMRGLLARNGYRIIEQRIPRRAYVILREEPREPGMPAAPRGAVAGGPRS